MPRLIDRLNENIAPFLFFGKSHDFMLRMVQLFVSAHIVELVFTKVPLWFEAYFLNKRMPSTVPASSSSFPSKNAGPNMSSVTVTINITDYENVLGQALLDYITNHQNAKHISFKRQNFLLNQKDVLDLGNDIFCKMTETVDTGLTGTGTNANAGINIVQIIELFSPTQSVIKIRDLLDMLRRNYVAALKNKLGKTRHYFSLHPAVAPMNMDGKKDLARLPNHFTFDMKPFHTNRRFDNLFGEEIDAIRTRVQHFVKGKAWYDEKGIPYTLGLLLSGPPGTGKTSTIKCLANETNRHILSVNLNTDMTKLQLENLFFNENLVIVSEGQSHTVCIPLDQRIYVLEDVDAQQGGIVSVGSRQIEVDPSTHLRGRSHPYEQNDLSDRLRVDLSFLLNLLDGILENPGRIVIMTSNYPERLDSALIRPGRIDVMSRFKCCSHATIQKMLEFFYDTPLTEIDKKRIGKYMKKDVWTPAELSRIMFEHFSDLEGALKTLCSKELELQPEELKLEAYELDESTIYMIQPL